MKTSNTLAKIYTVFLMSVALIIFITTFRINNPNRSGVKVNQIEKLDQVSKDLQSLQQYIKDQEKNLIDQEQVLRQLKEEKEELEPLLNAKKEVVDALFLQQAKNQSKNIWWERGYGFVFGIIASLIASILYDFFRIKLFNKKEVTDPANND